MDCVAYGLDIIGLKGYRRISTTTAHADARQLCQTYQCDLATFNTPDEVTYVKNQASKCPWSIVVIPAKASFLMLTFCRAESGDMWIAVSNPNKVDCNNNACAGQLPWYDGSGTLDPGDFNKVSMNEKIDCIRITRKGEIHDRDCSRKYAYLCMCPC